MGTRGRENYDTSAEDHHGTAKNEKVKGQGRSQKLFKSLSSIFAWLTAGGALGAWVGGICGSAMGAAGSSTGVICGAVAGMTIGTTIGVLIAASDNETLNEFGNMAQRLVNAVAFAGQTFDNKP